VRVIRSVFHWLGSVINICNKEMGTPFDRCEKVFEGAVADCRAKLGPIFKKICNITYIVETLCYIVKPLDFVCTLVSYIGDTIIGSVRNSTHSDWFVAFVGNAQRNWETGSSSWRFEQQRILHRDVRITDILHRFIRLA